MGGLCDKEAIDDEFGDGSKGSVLIPLVVPELTAYDYAMLEVKTQRDKLNKFKAYLDARQQVELHIIKQFIHQKQLLRATTLLRQRRVRAKRIQQVEIQLTNTQELVNSLDWADKQVQIIATIREGTDALKMLQTSSQTRDICTLLDENASSVQVQIQIDSALASVLDEQDEKELISELARLQEQCTVERPMLNRSVFPPVPVVPPVPVFPPVPAHRIASSPVLNSSANTDKTLKGVADTVAFVSTN